VTDTIMKGKVTPATLNANTSQKVRKNYRQAGLHSTLMNEVQSSLTVSKDSLSGKDLEKVLTEFSDLCRSVDKRSRYRVVLFVEKL
jgi:ribosomal protein L4